MASDWGVEEYPVLIEGEPRVPAFRRATGSRAADTRANSLKKIADLWSNDGYEYRDGKLFGPDLNTLNAMFPLSHIIKEIEREGLQDYVFFKSADPDYSMPYEEAVFIGDHRRTLLEKVFKKEIEGPFIVSLPNNAPRDPVPVALPGQNLRSFQIPSPMTETGVIDVHSSLVFADISQMGQFEKGIGAYRGQQFNALHPQRLVLAKDASVIVPDGHDIAHTGIGLQVKASPSLMDTWAEHHAAKPYRAPQPG